MVQVYYLHRRAPFDNKGLFVKENAIEAIFIETTARWKIIQSSIFVIFAFGYMSANLMAPKKNRKLWNF